MSNTLRSAAILFVFGIAVNAQAIRIDFVGPVGDADFRQIRFETNSDEPASLVSFSFDYEAVGTSWGSDILIHLYHSDSDTTIVIGTETLNDDGLIGCSGFRDICDYNLEWFDAPGTYTASAIFDLSELIESTNGTWFLTLADSFNDVGGNGQFSDGSFIAVRTVPVPAAIWFLGSALIGLRLFSRRAATSVSERSTLPI